MKEIVFIVPQLSQPRCIKRIQSVFAASIPAKVYGFDRGVYSENLSELDFPVEIIWKNPGKNKLSRNFFLLSKLFYVFKKHNGKCVFYIFGSEFMNYMKLFGCNNNYIYEEADVSAVKKTNPLMRRLFVNLDKYCINHSDLTILTSQGFQNYLFPNTVLNNVILIPNKLSNYFNHKNRPHKSSKQIDYMHIRFAFIGLIRYPNTILRFAEVIGKHYPQHEFHFYGDTLKQYDELEKLKKHPNIYFHGSFRNPFDLDFIYSNVDINVVCYDTNSINVQIAEPNKLYESIFFNTPIVVSDGTFLGSKVRSLNVGYCIDASLDHSVKIFVDSISPISYNDKLSAINNIGVDDLIDQPQQLIKRIQTIVVD